jgi:hypothetical protein
VPRLTALQHTPSDAKNQPSPHRLHFTTARTIPSRRYHSPMRTRTTPFPTSTYTATTITHTHPDCGHGPHAKVQPANPFARNHNPRSLSKPQHTSSSSHPLPFSPAHSHLRLTSPNTTAAANDNVVLRRREHPSCLTFPMQTSTIRCHAAAHDKAVHPTLSNDTCVPSAEHELRFDGRCRMKLHAAQTPPALYALTCLTL